VAIRRPCRGASREQRSGRVLNGVGADRQVKWRLSRRCDFNKQAAESVVDPTTDTVISPTVALQRLSARDKKRGQVVFGPPLRSAMGDERSAQTATTTAENHRRGYSLRSATLGSTAAALRAGK
jgi:hypothetical protein